ncbi:patatin [Litorilituus lipolyticus]|uniref:Patatin n=2 Tax=Litorilituus lipolyticus TaxID=2491017 RepID=A0A502KY10_9GAMM|nr:patatin-like phospholipase family protein [Litorilituus lipolyticus]TPH16522.1 patatin [Litorilituus lipolyticus]
MRLHSLLLLISLAFAPLGEASDTRAKIGLVLSGGGAKGSAHIGVLKVLEQEKVPVDYIVGTSIGAYVAGMYALGYSVEEIETIMLSLPWDDGYSDFIPREDLSYRNKQFRDRYNLGVRLGFSEGEIKVPHGLLLGQSAYQILRKSTDTVPAFESFDELAIPYRAVASDITTAEVVILSKGSIHQAMKASAAVPGIVSAVEIDGKTLVDGGIANNMPIDVVKAMGADIVIAVDIGSPLAHEDELTSTVAVLNQLSTILTNNTTLAQKELLTEKDILIRPAIDNLSTTDWSVLPKALELGEKQAQEQIEQIKKLSVSNEEFIDYQKHKLNKSKKWLATSERPVVKINYENNSNADVDIIAQHFAIDIGSYLTKEQLDEAINRVYALDMFESVNVEIDDVSEGKIIVLQTKAKSWGPNYLDFGFSLKTDFHHRTITELNVAYLMTDINKNGGQWLNEVRVGWETMLGTEFYQPIGKYQQYFARTRLEYGHEKWERTKERYELTNKYALAKLGLGYNYVFNGLVEVGGIAEKGDLSVDVQTVGKYDYDSYGGYLKAEYDSLNSINFPTEGNKLSFNVFWREDSYSRPLTKFTEDTSVEITFDWRGAIGFRGHTFVGIVSLATVESDVGSDFTVHVTELGGFLNLSGYQEDALIGAHKAFAALAYQYDLGRDIPGAFGLPMYLGASIEMGNIWQIDDSVKHDDLIHSGSLYLGTDTSFGPAVFGVGVASKGEYSFFLSIGKNW